MNEKKEKPFLSRRGKVLFDVFFVMITTFSTMQTAVAEETSLISSDFFYNNFVLFAAACVGEPQFISISDDSRLIHIDSPRNPETLKREARMGKLVWLEPNCSFLNVGDDQSFTDLTSGNYSFLTHSFSLNSMRLAADILIRNKIPVELSEILLIKNSYFSVKYYTDSDLSGTFDDSEQVSTAGLTKDQIDWEFTLEEFVGFDFIDHFRHRNEYSASGGVYLKIADFKTGPLDGRTLYLITTKFEEIQDD